MKRPAHRAEHFAGKVPVEGLLSSITSSYLKIGINDLDRKRFQNVLAAGRRIHIPSADDK